MSLESISKELSQSEKEILGRALHRLYNEVTEFIRANQTNGIVTRDMIDAAFRDRQAIANLAHELLGVTYQF